MHVVDSLRDFGFTVLESGDTDEATALLQANAVDLVFTDITLPGEFDGFGLVEWIRARTPRLPVILTSGGHNAELAAQRCKGEPFLEKPYDVVKLSEWIVAMLARAGTAT